MAIQEYFYCYVTHDANLTSGMTGADEKYPCTELDLNSRPI